MARSNVLLTALGILLAVAAGAAVFVALAAAREQAPAPVLVQPVVVANQDIERGTTFDAGRIRTLLRVDRIPVDQAPPDALTSLTELEGKTTPEGLRAGQRLTRSILTGQAARAPSLVGLLPRGRVAVLVPVTDQMTLGGAVQPTDLVDVVATIPVRDPEGGQNLVTQALFRDVPVLSTGSQTAPSTDPANPRQNYTSITLALPPDDVLVVQHLLASNVRMVLTLRRPEDPASTDPVSMDQIIRRFGLAEKR